MNDVHSIRQAISDIENDLKSTIDTRISPKFIYSKLVNNLANIVKQTNETKRIWKSSDFFQKIHCLDMTKISAADCSEIFPLVKEYIAKSSQKLSPTYTSAAGDMVKEIVSILPYGRSFRLVTAKEYRAIRQREFQDPSTGYAFILDNYLYIPDSEIEKVSLTGAFKNPKTVAILNGEDPCKPFLDYQFYMPEYLRKVVHDLTLQDLSGVFEKVVEDADPNENSNDRGTPPGKKRYE